MAAKPKASAGPRVPAPSNLPRGPLTLVAEDALRRIVAETSAKSKAQAATIAAEERRLLRYDIEEALWTYLRRAGDTAAARERAVWFGRIVERVEALQQLLRVQDSGEDWPAQHFSGAAADLLFVPDLPTLASLLEARSMGIQPDFLRLTRQQLSALAILARQGGGTEALMAGARSGKGRPEKVPQRQLLLRLGSAFRRVFGQDPKAGWDGDAEERSGPFLVFTTAVLDAAENALPVEAERHRALLRLTPAQITGPFERAKRRARKPA